MNKLVQELDKIKQKEWDAINGNLIVQEAKTLLLGAHDADAETLNKLGLDHHIKFERELKQDVLRSAKAEEIYNTSAFTGKQIKALCSTYYMKLLPSAMYNGSIPSDLARIAAKFAEDNDVSMNGGDFFILAPVELFNNIKHVPIRPEPIDPILFYRDRKGRTTSAMSATAEEDQTFVSVHNWGNDFTWARSLKVLMSGFVHDSDDVSPRFWTWFSIFMATLSIGFGFGGVWTASVVFVAIAAASMLLFNTKESYPIDSQWNVNKI